MKTILWTKYGPPDVLKLVEANKPGIKDGEVLVKVAATTASLGDCEIRALKLPFAFRLPIRFFYGFFKPKRTTLGQEFSGTVEAVGSGVTQYKAGDAVFGQTGVSMGAYAQYLAVKKDAIIANKPENISFEVAAAMPVGGLEAKYFVEKSGLGAGNKALVIGAGGSIGTMAIQLLKLRGAEVTAVDAGEKFHVMKQAGADHLIDYTKSDYLNGSLRFDGVFDVVGKTSLKKGIALLKPGGAYMHANPKIRQMLFRRFYTGHGKKLIFKQGEQSPSDMDYLAELMETGKARPLIDRVMPLEDIVAAHKYVEAGKKKGNLVIIVE